MRTSRSHFGRTALFVAPLLALGLATFAIAGIDSVVIISIGAPSPITDGGSQQAGSTEVLVENKSMGRVSVSVVNNGNTSNFELGPGEENGLDLDSGSSTTFSTTWLSGGSPCNVWFTFSHPD